MGQILMNNWVLVRTGKWHAWPHKGLRSLCGTLAADDLRVTPAKAIEKQLPEGANFCMTCARKVNATELVPTLSKRKHTLGSEARVWLPQNTPPSSRTGKRSRPTHLSLHPRHLRCYHQP